MEDQNKEVSKIKLCDGSVVYFKDGTARNTTDSSDLQYTKLFLIGSEVQGKTSTTASNANVYIGEDNQLYTNGNKVMSEAIVATEDEVKEYFDI